MGDLKRECLEELCTYEEAREVFEHTEITVRTVLFSFITQSFCFFQLANKHFCLSVYCFLRMNSGINTIVSL